MIQAILFDCFGVLYADVRRTYYGQFPSCRDELHNLNRQSDRGLIDKQTYIAEVAILTGVGEREIALALTSRHALNQPLIDLIQHRFKARYKIGLVSNIGRDWIYDFFDKRQITDLFDVVVLSGDEGITKPNPLLFEYAAHRLNMLPEECVMIDDRQENCDGAETAGMRSVLFTDIDSMQQQLKQLLSHA